MYSYNGESVIESELHEHTETQGLSWSLWFLCLVCFAAALLICFGLASQINEYYQNNLSAENKYSISAQLDKPGFLFVLNQPLDLV